MAHKQYKFGQIVTLYGKKYRIMKNLHGCRNCCHFTLPMNRTCRWCLFRLNEDMYLQEIKPKHE